GLGPRLSKLVINIAKLMSAAPERRQTNTSNQKENLIMSTTEMKDNHTVATANTVPETSESPDRRSFLKNTIMMAGAPATAGLATASVHASPGPGRDSGATLADAAGSASGILQVRFDPRQRPTLDDLYYVIAQIVDRYGCPACGFLGIIRGMEIVV